MDMGFTREQATVALSNTTSVEQATEYILSNPIPTAGSVSNKQSAFYKSVNVLGQELRQFQSS